jgi:hypothetical protein
MDTYQISKDLLNKIFIGLINSESIKNSANKDVIGDILLKDLPQHSIEHIIHLTLSEDQYEPLNKGDHFKVKPIKYDMSRHYEPDVLCDMGLSDSDRNIFGYVVADTSWSSTEYNPLYSQLKVNLYYHDSDLKIKEHETNMSPLELTKINKLDIPYFNKPAVEQPSPNQLTLELM